MQRKVTTCLYIFTCLIFQVVKKSQVFDQDHPIQRVHFHFEIIILIMNKEEIKSNTSLYPGWLLCQKSPKKIGR